MYLNEMDYQNSIIQHYTGFWKKNPSFYYWSEGPVTDLSPVFRVLEFPPNDIHKMWTYATCCMSNMNDPNPVELHLFSSVQDTSLTELLTIVAHYHKTGSPINLDHTINFGRPWQNRSKCEYGLVSLPYLDGPELENFELSDKQKTVKFYWLIPITKNEVEFKKLNGIEQLEQEFDNKEFNYLDPLRESVV